MSRTEKELRQENVRLTEEVERLRCHVRNAYELLDDWKAWARKVSGCADWVENFGLMAAIERLISGEEEDCPDLVLYPQPDSGGGGACPRGEIQGNSDS